MKKASLLITLVLLSNVLIAQSGDAYLQKVLNNLRQIRSATYFSITEPFAPGDTVASRTYFHYFKEYDNPADSTIGASFAAFPQDDTTKMQYCYDGKMKASVYMDEKFTAVDSFKNNPRPFRPLSPPFFNYAKSIIKYALETDDSITTDLKDLGDSIHFSLSIYANKQVEFFGKPYHLQGPYPGDEVSRYDIWISKSNDLPYCIRREMSHDVSVRTCYDVVLNKGRIEDFVASDYFSPDHPVNPPATYRAPKSTLAGQPAADWILRDADNKTVALKQLKSKVVMIQFTSVSCGPCRLSISFLKQLAAEYDPKDFDFVSIESFNRNSMVLKKYREKNNFNYDFLLSTADVTKTYKISMVPVFYILDKDRVIRKVVSGYKQGVSDKEIRDAINKLL
jgi:thiol-disulfide isomerase/thioredoxin